MGSIKDLADRRSCTPTALRWSHPRSGLPHADVVVVAGEGRHGALGPASMSTRWHADHGRLPVVSVVAHDDDLFGGDRGLLVPGHTMLAPPKELAEAYSGDPMFWKYPGNYHQRGKQWERRALVQFLNPDGTESWQRPVALRINGQQTRGLAQHALRVLFDAPLDEPLFGEGSEGLDAMIVRSAGNDQVKAMMRDALQHALCEELPFDTSPALPVVLYINGAYWGVHHLRPRMDHKELARRIGAKPKDITIVEDRGVLYRGSEESAAALRRLIKETERREPGDTAWLRTLEVRLDVEEFMVYMASQMILGNMDWPEQNIRFWRREKGAPGHGRGDGRWHMAMGDSDLGFGSIGAPGDDLFVRVKTRSAPASRLLMALLRERSMRERFARITEALLEGALSPARCQRELERWSALLEPEMGRHTDRWRKPASLAVWRSEVDALKRFGAERAMHVRARMEGFVNTPGF